MRRVVLCVFGFGLSGCMSADPRPPSPDALDEVVPDAAVDAPPVDAPVDVDAPPVDAPLDAPDLDAPDVDAPPTATAPVVVAVELPAEMVGVIGLRVTVEDATSTLVDLSIELRCGAETAWRPATMLDGLDARATGIAHPLRWDSLGDVAFHAPAACSVRVIATDPGGLVSAPLIVALPLIDNLREAARRVDRYMIHYGDFDAAMVAAAHQHQLIILDPHHADLTRAKVAAIQRGADPDDPGDDVIVLCYVSIGEDIRTTWLTDEEMLADPRFVGDGSGPRIDPRGPAGSGQSLAGIAPLGLPSDGGGGYASFYLDDNDVFRDGMGDGRPDRNTHFGGAFVNAGDPAWYAAVRAMRLDGDARVAGLDEALTASAGRGLDCDGVFLDTVDTAAPNSFTGSSSSNPSKFEWTAPGFQLFIERLRAGFPRKVVLQNRGLFFFDPRHHQFAFHAGAALDYVLFESFRLDSSSAHEYHPYYFPDNRHNVAPKLMVEANRGQGFRVLSLGYAEGPSSTMSELTLVGDSTLGFASLIEDIAVSEGLGFRHYLANSSLTLDNTFVLEHGSLADDAAPVWSSTWNDNHQSWPGMPQAPTPRIGVQQLVPGDGRLTLRWDVALDRQRVRYVAYVSAGAFDLATAERRPLSPRLGAGYVTGVGVNKFAHEADLTGLSTGVTYAVVVRAVDEGGREDPNLRVLSAAPL